MADQACPICNRLSQVTALNVRDADRVDCTVCGRFEISWEAKQYLQNVLLDDIKKIAISHWLYNQSPDGEKIIVLTGDIVSKVFPNLKQPSIDEQFTNLISYLGNNAKSPDQPVSIFNNRFSSIVGSFAVEGANYIINYLEKNNLVQRGTGNNVITSLILTPEGWERFGRINKGEVNSKKVFMAMKYDDQLLIDAYKFFQYAVEETGFKLNILDEVLKAGLIDDQLRVNIRQAKFILADLTRSNAGAYWEAGFAEGLGKQVIYLCEKSYWEANKTHFDTNHHTTVIWSLPTIEEDMKKLKATIRTSFPTEAIMEDINF